MQPKIHHGIDFEGADALYWYTGLYLGLNRVFMSVVKKKLVPCAVVGAILMPSQIVYDPISCKRISVSITDRYFFIGTYSPIYSEYDLGIHMHTSTIILIRKTEVVNDLARIRLEDIRQVIYTYENQRQNTLQEDVTVLITGGTFKDWYGVVVEKSYDSKVKVNFTSDEFECAEYMPVPLCRPA